jgi:ABC-type nitrate/sulfonate/bicarbonate transport system substrate-binding protein
MTKSRRIALALTSIAICAFGLVFFLWPQDGGKKFDGPMESIILGLAKHESTTLFFVAAELGLFKDQGLDVTIVEYPAGLMAAEALLGNKVDVAAATEFVVVTKNLCYNDVNILASIVRSDTLEVVARRDRGITEPVHLKGKRIGLTHHSIADFFLDTFLSHQGISRGSVTFVDLPPLEIPAALSSGSVDAALTWEPLTWQIKERLGPNVVHWPGQSGRCYYSLLITRADFVKKRPRAAERLLRALIEAENYAAGHTPETQDLMARRLGYNPGLIKSLWPRCDFRVRLDQDLLTLMEDEAKWAIRRKGLKQEMPNYLDVIDCEILEKIKPEAVSIIH